MTASVPMVPVDQLLSAVKAADEAATAADRRVATIRRMLELVNEESGLTAPLMVQADGLLTEAERGLNPRHPLWELVQDLRRLLPIFADERVQYGTEGKDHVPDEPDPADKIDELEKKIAVLEAEKEELVAERDAAEQARDELKAALADRQARLDALIDMVQTALRTAAA